MTNRIDSLFDIELQLFAEGDAGTGVNGTGDAGKDGKDGKDGSNGDAGKQTPPKTFTQDELDKVVAERLKRETTKYEKKMADMKKALDGSTAGDKPEGAGATTPDENTVKAQALMEAANQKLVLAVGISEAVKLGVDPKYTTDVIKLADTTGCVKEDGTVDEAAISKAIGKVIERLPQFKVTTEGQGYKFGTTSNSSKQENSGFTQPKPDSKPWNKFNR